MFAQMEHWATLNLDLNDVVVNQVSDPAIQPSATSTETCDQPVMQVVTRRRSITGEISENGSPPSYVEIR